MMLCTPLTTSPDTSFALPIWKKVFFQNLLNEHIIKGDSKLGILLKENCFKVRFIITLGIGWKPRFRLDIS